MRTCVPRDDRRLSWIQGGSHCAQTAVPYVAQGGYAQAADRDSRSAWVLSRPLRADLSALPKIGLPAILHWDLNHFVVLTRVSQGVRGTRYHIQDPATGTLSVGEAEFSRRFTGVLLELVKSEAFRPEADRTQLRLNQLWSRIEGFWPALRQLFLLSAVIQLASLISPFFLQISIDTVLPSFDADLLLVLAIGFGGVALVSMVTAWVRSLVLVRLGASLSYQVTVNLFRHLLRLPLPGLSAATLATSSRGSARLRRSRTH